MAYNITLIPGDGIGPEVTTAAVRVLEATDVKFNWEIVETGVFAEPARQIAMIDSIKQSILKNKIALKGPTTTLMVSNFRGVNAAIRKGLDLYACLRPCKLYPGVRSPYNDVDIVVVRENTEDVLSGIEFDKGSPEAQRLIQLVNEIRGNVIKSDAAIALKVITQSGSWRIIKFALDYARNNNRKKVTAIHKATALKFSDGLFLRVGREVAKSYPEVEFDEVIVDTLCMQLVRNPQQFDVLVLPNLYGDIVSDLCAGLVGGLGVAPGANIGDGMAVFESAHGSAPKYAGQNKVNPIAAMLSGVLMLRYLKETESAERLQNAIMAVMAEGKNVTYDLKPNKIGGVGTSQVADAVIEKLRR